MRRDSRLILALDVRDAGTALRLVKECRGTADAVKVGWPLTLSAGPQLISRIAAEADVICDFKIADIPPIAGTITAAAFALGAKGVICHGFAGGGPACGRAWRARGGTCSSSRRGATPVSSGSPRPSPGTLRRWR